VERVHHLALLDCERDTESALHRRRALLDPEEGCAFSAEAGCLSHRLHQERHSDWREQSFVRGLTAVIAADPETGVVERWLGHHSPAFTLATYVHLLDGDLGEPLALKSANKVQTSFTPSDDTRPPRWRVNRWHRAKTRDSATPHSTPASQS